MPRANSGKKLTVWLLALLTIAMLLFWLFVSFMADQDDVGVKAEPVQVEALVRQAAKVP